MPLEELLAVAARHQVEQDGEVLVRVRVRVRVEQDGEVLGAHVQPAAADDARVDAHAQQLDLVLEVALRTRREERTRSSACTRAGLQV